MQLSPPVASKKKWIIPGLFLGVVVAAVLVQTGIIPLQFGNTPTGETEVDEPSLEDELGPEIAGPDEEPNPSPPAPSQLEPGSFEKTPTQPLENPPSLTGIDPMPKDPPGTMPFGNGTFKPAKDTHPLAADDTGKIRSAGGPLLDPGPGVIPADGTRTGLKPGPFPGPTADTIDTKLAQLGAQIRSGDMIAAHRELSRMYWLQPKHRARFARMLDQTSLELFFLPSQDYLQRYTVQQGEQLEDVARKFNVPANYLARFNGFRSLVTLKDGQKLRVNRGPFSAVIDLKRKEITVHAHNYFVRRYRIGIGREAKLPLGTFKVADKVRNPPYSTPRGQVIRGGSPDNPYGTAWITLNVGGVRRDVGIHGTNDARTLGQISGPGSVRLSNDTMNVVVDLLGPGSTVVIRE